MGRGGPLQNKDQVLIALLVILYSPISPMGLILGLAARALGTVWLLCKSGSFRGARFETTEGLIKVSALGLVAGPVLTLCLPICVMFFGFNTFIVSYYQARAQEPPLFFQKYEWRGPPGRTGGHHRKQVNNLETSSECEGDGISYQYEPLREEHDIRVLEIHPGSPDDDLQVSLGLANLTHHPLFDALSYTWADESGDARRSVPVTVHSSADSPAGTSGLPIFLTPNCAAAMRRLRRRYAARPVWIDAVCIDQAGKAERTHQVSLMARIYTQARQVVVYTGEANLSPVKLFAWLEGLDGRSLDVPVLMRRLRLLTPFQTMNSVVDDAIHLLRLATGGDSSSFLTDPSVVKSSLSISPSELQELIHDFISRRWFSRVWVVQELALVDVRNTVVLAGDEEVSAVRVMHAVSLLQSDHYSASVKGNDAIDIFVLLARGALGTYYGSGNGQRYTASHLLDMLIATRAHASEDPRDKIFAVLSIAREWDDATFIRGRSDSHRERLPAADYSLSTHEVFTRFSVHFIREHGVGFFLSLIKSPPQAVTDAVRTRQEDVAAVASAMCNETRDDLIISDQEGEDDEMVLMLRRPRILSGFFTTEGHLDGAADILETSHMESVGDLEGDRVLVEVHPGLALLLQEESGTKNYYTLIRACPCARTQQALKDVVSQWSSVVLGLKSPANISDGEPEHLYLSERQLFKIR